METNLRQLSSAEETSFLNFLRGMETQEFGGLFERRVLFLNFLRGMETLNVVVTSCFLEFLPKLP